MRALVLALLAALAPLASAKTLDGFENPGDWKIIASDQVTGTLRTVDGIGGGHALCLDYDFHGVSGYVGIQRPMPMEYPSDYAFSYELRGDGPDNDLQFKLTDASGDNVWWVAKPRFAMPSAWTSVVMKKRQISHAWGPAADPNLHSSQKLEFTIASGAGGKGSACFDELRFEPRVPDDGSPLVAAEVSRFTYDLGRVREFGGLTLAWSKHFASDYDVELSNDGRTWRVARQVRGGNGGIDWIALPESEARYVRLKLPGSAAGDVALERLTVEPLAFAATTNAFLQSVAKASPRGQFPRGFSGEQPYWTIVGIDGGREQGLIGEDGAIEVGKGGFSIEPFVESEGKLVGWADVTSAQSLQDDYLPIPSVAWSHPGFSLTVTAFAQGTPDHSQLVARYHLGNTGATARDVTLLLALRPLQVNPPSQFLNTPGGVSPIKTLKLDHTQAWVDDRVRLRLLAPANASSVTAFDAAEVASAESVEDAQGLASGMWRYAVHLAPGESCEFAWVAPLSGDLPAIPMDVAAAQEAVAADWRAKLNRVQWQVPASAQHVIDTLRTGVANMLISRQGPRLQPGTRSYARAWIRDGAMISEALLRTGHGDVAEQFLRWYAPYQFDSGKVPCCVDDRGSDPVPENDSQGELLFTLAEVYRYTHDRGLLAQLWPHALATVKYMDMLRLSERTEANRAVDPAFYGMMPASISHEGYSAKPMHSYWDDFWSLRGYRDAVAIAQWLGHDDEARMFAASREQFDQDLQASIAAAIRRHGIDYLPGAAELGDFDATSSTIALTPGDEQGRLPDTLVEYTFERYWRKFTARRDGAKAWKDYTPYELRVIGSFVRLGWRDRVQSTLDFFLADQQPRGWNQWAEVVSHTPRAPFFLGDLPHAWVASDYVRSVLDMFAYTRDSDDALVIAAGIPDEWLDAAGIAVGDLRTPYGSLSYSLRRDGKAMKLHIDAGLQLPAGGIVYSRRGGELRIRKLPADVDIPAP
jgi:hypothetical protein